MRTPRRAMMGPVGELIVVSYDRNQDDEVLETFQGPFYHCASPVSLPENCPCKACELWTLRKKVKAHGGVFSFIKEAL